MPAEAAAGEYENDGEKSNLEVAVDLRSVATVLTTLSSSDSLASSVESSLSEVSECTGGAPSPWVGEGREPHAGE